MRRWHADNGGYTGYDVERLQEDEWRPFIKATPVYKESDPRFEEAWNHPAWPLVHLRCNRGSPNRGHQGRCTKVLAVVMQTRSGPLWIAYRHEPEPFEKQSASLSPRGYKVEDTPRAVSHFLDEAPDRLAVKCHRHGADEIDLNVVRGLAEEAARICRLIQRGINDVKPLEEQHGVVQ